MSRPLRKSLKRPKPEGNPRKIKFSLAAKPGSKVYLAGSFNDWSVSKNRMRYSNSTGKYGATIVLAPGTYEYKFIIDDTWLIDPECDSWTSNRFDTLNSVLTVE